MPKESETLDIKCDCGQIFSTQYEWNIHSGMSKGKCYAYTYIEKEPTLRITNG